MPRRRRSPKSLLNQLIDEALHPRGAPRDLGTIILDELCHTAVEGKFRPDKFMRYTLMPNMMRKRRRED